MEKQIRNYLKILETSPDNVPAFNALAKIYQDHERWGELAGLYVSKAEKTANAEQIPKMLFEAAEIYAERLAKLDKVEECYLRVLESDPLNEAALDKLKLRYRDSHQWDQLIHLLTQEAGHREDAVSKADVLTEVAELWEKELGNEEKKLHYLSLAQEASPDHLPSLKQLKTHYLKTFQVERAIALVEREESLLTKKAEKGQLYFEVGSLLAEDPFEKERAIDFLEQAVAAGASKKAAKQKLKELRSLDKSWEELTKRYQEDAINASDKREASSIYLKVAGIYYLYAPDNEEGILSTIEKSLILDSGNRRALLLGERYLSEQERWEALSKFYAEIYDRTRDEKLKVEAMGKAAVLLADKLDQAGESLELSRKVIELNPDDTQAFARVSEDLQKSEKWDELKALLVDRQARCHEIEAKIDTYLQLAKLASEQEGDVDGAIERLEQVLELNPGNPKASGALIPLYQQTAHYDRLMDVFPAAIEAADDPIEKRSMELSFAEMLKDRLSDPEAAYPHYAAAFMLDPMDKEGFGQLEELTIELEFWEELVAALAGALDAEERPDNWRELKFRMGQIYDRELSQYDDAESCYRELIEVEPDLETLDALGRLYSKDLKWESLVEVFGMKASITEDVEERRDVLLEKARILEQEIDDKDGAIAAYREALEVEPGELDALKRLEELYEQQKQWAELVEAIELQLEVITSIPEKINLNFKCGGIYGERLSDAEAAAKAYLTVLELDSSHLPAIEMLENYLSQGVLADRIFRGLEEYYRKLERWDKLAVGYEALIKSEEDEQAKGMLYHKLAEVLFLHRDLPEDAFKAISEGLKTPYQSPEFLSLALDVGRKMGQQTEVLESLENKAADIEDASQKARLSLSMGKLYWESMQDSEHAQAHFLSAAEALPDDPATIEEVVTFFRATEQWDEFVSYADMLSASTSDPAKSKEILFDLSDVLTEKLSDNEGARERLRKVLESDPSDIKAMDRLLALLRADEMWDDVALLTRDKLDRSEQGPARIELKMDLAGVFENKLEDFDEAASLYAQVLADDPHHPSAFSAMERFLENGWCEKKVADTLQPVYEDRREFDKLVQVLTLQHKHAEGDPAHQLAISIASLNEEELADYDQALSWYGKAFISGKGVGLLRELSLSASEANDYARFVELADEKLEQELSDAERVELLFAAAEAQYDRLQDDDAARIRYRSILEVEEQNEKAIDALIELARKKNDDEELADLLQLKRMAAEEKSVARQAALEEAEIRFLSLEQPDEALAVLRELMEERENDPQVFERCEEILQATDRWEDLHELLGRRLKYLREDEDILPVKIQMGSILENNLEQPEEAMGIYNELIRNYWSYPVVGALVDRLLAQESTQLAVADEMAQKYIKVGDWQRLVTVYEIQIHYAEGPDQKAELLSKLSAVYQDKLQDPQKAFDGFARLFIDDPQNARALEELEKLAGDLGAWKELAEVYEKAGEANEQDDEAIELYIKAARLYEDILAFQEDAIRAFRKVLDRDRNNMTSVQALEGLCRKTERWEELRDIYLQRIDLTEDVAEKKELYANICILYEHQLEDPLGATPYYESIMELTPDDLEVVDKLIELNDSLERWPEKAELLAHKLELIESGPEKNMLMLEKAALHEDRLDDEESAKDLYKDVLSADGDSESALHKLEYYVDQDEFQDEIARFLAPYYRERELWHELIDMLEFQFSHSEDAEERLLMLMDMAEIYEQRLDQDNLAYAVMTRAFREKPIEEFVQSELERLAGQLGQFEQLTVLYGEQLDAMDEEEQAEQMVNLLLNAAHLFETHLKQMEEAASRYRRVLELHENHLEALTNLERIYSLQQKWPELIDVLERKNEISEQIEDRKSILFQVCNIYEDELGDNSSAIETYNRMLEMDAADVEVLRALVRLTTAEQRWEELVEIRYRQLDIAEDDDQRWSLRHQIAMTLWKKLDRTDEAIEIFKGVLDENHVHELSREAMEGLLFEDDSELAAARILEPLYAEEDRYNDLIDTLAIQADHSEDSEERRDLYLRMAELAEGPVDEASRSMDYAIKAFNNDAFNDTIRERMERLAAETDRFGDLAIAYRDQAQGVEETSQQVDLYLNAGRITLREMNDPEAAEPFYGAVRVRQADNSDALDALDEIFARTEQWPELVDVYFTKADLAEDANEKIDLFVRSARVQEQKMLDRDIAVQSYLKALEVDENHNDSLFELDRLYGELEQWENLRDILARRVGLAQSPEEAYETTFRMGGVVEHKLEDSAAALEIYQSILAEDDEYEDSIASIERMIADVDRQQEALDVLVPLFEGKSWWERLGELYESQLETQKEAETRIGILSRIKDVYEHRLSDAVRAFQVACRIFQEDYYDQEARQEMERLAVATGGFEGLVQTYRSFYDQMDSGDLKIEIMMKIARIHEEQLQDNEAAMESYREVRALDQSNFTAILALDRLYERLAMYTDLVELIPDEFELLDDPKEVTELRLRLGRLWEEKLGDNLTAIEVYRQVIDEHPDHPAALASLEKLYEAEEFWTELIEVYKAEVRIARGDTKKARLYARMAQVYHDKLGDAKQAIPLWNRVLQFDEQNSEVMERLESLYEDERMWDELVTHYKKRLRMARGAQDRAIITRKMGWLYLNQLDQPDQATQLLLKVLEYTPNDLETIDTLEEIYLKNRSWRELTSLLTRLIPQVDGPELRSLYLRLASINVEHLDNLEEGRELAEKALSMDPNAEELTRLEQMFRETDSYRLYLQVLERQAALTDDEATLVALYFRMVAIWQEKLDDNGQARVYLEKVLALVPDHLQAAEALEPIYREAAEWFQYIDVLKIRLAESTETDEMVQLNGLIGETYESKLEAPSEAFDAFGAVFSVDPSDEALLSHLEDLSDKADRYLDLVHLIREALPLSEGNPKLSRSLTLKVAEIYETKAENRDLAAEFYNIFLEAGEYNAHAVDYLIDYYGEVEDWEELVRAYQLKIPHMNQEEKVDVGCKVAEIFNVHMGQIDRAVKTYRQVLKMDESNAVATEALISIFEREEQWEPLVEALRHKLHLVGETESINEIRIGIAGIYREKLDDSSQAKIFYRAVVADDPRHEGALDQLENIYEEEENYDELLEVLSRRVNVTEQDSDKIAIYRKMADIWETKFEQLDMAINYLEKILAIEPDNMIAIETLERIHRDAGDWPALAATYQRHIDQTIEAEEIVRLFTEMGRIYGEYLFQPSKAIEYFSKALKIDEENIGVMAALSELYVANEKWDEAIDTLQRIAEISSDKAERVNALASLGNIYLNNLDMKQEAKAVFDRMIEEDPTFVPALRALRQYYGVMEDWPSFLNTVEEEKRYVEDAGEKAALLFEEGSYYHEKEMDVDRALNLYQEAMELDDSFAPVLKVLGQIYFEKQAWEQARPVMLKQLELDGELETATKARIHYRLAFIAEKLSEDAEALKHYTASYKLDSNSLPTLEGLARALYKREDWDRAFRVYQTILVRFRDQKSVPELVEIFCRLGDVNGQLGKHDVAVRMYEKALELDPQSERALNAIVFYYESLENWKKVLHYRARLIKHVEGDELFEQWKAVGDVYSDKLENKEKGLEAYRHALEVKAQDINLLTRVADLLLEGGNVADAIGVLRSAASLEHNPENTVALNLRLGDLLREQGDAPEQCLDAYNAALDAAPDRSDIFATIESFLTEREDWEGLDNSYRLMIARLPEDADSERLAMWKKLGSLLFDRSGNLEDSIKVWEVVMGLEPDEPANVERIADLYARSPEHREQAVQMHRELLIADPKRINSYRALWKIHFEAEEFDRAFCFGGIVHYLGETDSTAAEFYKDNMAEVKSEAINTLDRQLWGTLLLHEYGHHAIGQVLNILFHHVHDLMPSDLKKEGLKKRDRLDLGEHINVCDKTTYIIKALALPTPEIYMKKGYGPGIEPLPIQPAALKIGADAFENFPQRELVFLIAKNSVLARPDFLLALMSEPQKVRDLLDAAAMIFDSKWKPQSPIKAIKPLKKKIEKAIPKKVREPLSGFVSEYTKAARDLDIELWRKALILSAHRAGMLMCNDLETSIETLRKHPGNLSSSLIEEIIDDLVNFSVSDSYFHLRNFLGFRVV